MTTCNIKTTTTIRPHSASMELSCAGEVDNDDAIGSDNNDAISGAEASNSEQGWG